MELFNINFSYLLKIFVVIKHKILIKISKMIKNQYFNKNNYSFLNKVLT